MVQSTPEIESIFIGSIDLDLYPPTTDEKERVVGTIAAALL